MHGVTGFAPEKISNARKKARRGWRPIEIGDGYDPNASPLSKIVKKAMRVIAARLAKPISEQPVTKSLPAPENPVPSSITSDQGDVKTLLAEKVPSISALNIAHGNEASFLNYLNESLKDQNPQPKQAIGNWIEDYPLVSKGLNIFEANNDKPLMFCIVDEYMAATNIPRDGDPRILLPWPDAQRGVCIIRKKTSVRGLALQVAEGTLLHLSSEEILLALLDRIKSCRPCAAPNPRDSESDMGQGVLVLLMAPAP